MVGGNFFLKVSRSAKIAPHYVELSIFTFIELLISGKKYITHKT